ncbi:HNH endonuclease family protein [Geomonas ferrireducens]|uniref:HNH endonuclease n=1 Tax=Geomonas ferrireducens TaxID=2570227 RepID=UPI001FEC2649|nr:HNH endonuclease [Geomonas ferrireducens]
MSPSFRPRGPKNVAPKSAEEIDELVRKLRGEQQRPENYREKSLKLHGWICAKCGREFELSNLHLLTVHHKDGNHNYNKFYLQLLAFPYFGKPILAWA